MRVIRRLLGDLVWIAVSASAVLVVGFGLVAVVIWLLWVLLVEPLAPDSGDMD